MSEAVLGPARAGVGSVRRLLDDVTPHDRAVARQARCRRDLRRGGRRRVPLLVLDAPADPEDRHPARVPGPGAVHGARARGGAGAADQAGTDIHDREVDYIIGVPLLLASLAINLLLPVRLSTMFWVWRVDLLALPLFVAGSIAVLFGVRTLWRLRFPVIFLLFAWPLPYTKLLMAQLQNFTNATLVAVKAALGVASIATPAAASDGSLFNITHAGKTFQVSVASACSGVNGLVGYTLVTRGVPQHRQGPVVQEARLAPPRAGHDLAAQRGPDPPHLLDREAVGRGRGHRRARTPISAWSPSASA